MSYKQFIDTINDNIALTQTGYIRWWPTYKPSEYRINIGNAIMSISYSKEQESENYTLKILNLSGDVLKTQVGANCVQAARGSRFSVDADAPATQTGTITYRFQ